MSQTSDIHVMLGEVRGQMREMIHGINNASTKIDALTREVAAVAAVPAALTALELRVSALEAERNRRAGALSLGDWIIRIVPWLVGGGAFALVAKMIGMGT